METQTKSEVNTYRTDDLCLAATLCTDGHTVVGSDVQNGRVYFTIVEHPRGTPIEEIVEAFREDRFRAIPRYYQREERRLLRMIRAARDQAGVRERRENRG